MNNNQNINQYYLILDQGTTSTRSLLYDLKFNIIDKVAIKMTQSIPKEDWVEHDPIEIYNSQLSTIQQLLNKNNLTMENIKSIGITNQRETIVAWDKKTGNPIYNAIVWSDNRCKDELFKYDDKKDLIFEKTGLILSPYFSALKMRWILDNVKKAKILNDNNQLMFGTIDSWLLFKLSNKNAHFTDHTNASRTMLYNINTLEWDDELLSLFDIKKSSLPTVKYSADFYYKIDNKRIDPLSQGTTPITSLCGDQQASLFGHQCFNKSQTKMTFGTGCFILINNGYKRTDFKNKLISTLSASFNNSINYALEGAIFNAGIVIEWLINNLKLIYHPSEIDWYAKFVLDSKPLQKNDIYFVPALNGLGTPYWNPDAKGAIFNLNINTRKEDIVKSSVEGIVYQILDIMNVYLSNKDNKLDDVEVDGGLTNSEYLCQFLSDMLNVKVNKQANFEITSLGSCYLTAMGNNDIDITSLQKYINKTYTPHITNELREKLYKRWKKYVQIVDKKSCH